MQYAVVCDKVSAAVSAAMRCSQSDAVASCSGGGGILVARLLDILGHEAILGVLPAVKQGELALLLRLQGQGAPRLARILAAVHKHHGLVPLFETVCCLHFHTHMLRLL